MTNFNDDAIPGLQYTLNTNERTPCVLLIDCSGSMASHMAAVNEGLRHLQDDLSKDTVARERITLLIVRVGGDEAEPSADWVDAMDFVPPTLEAEGLTPLGNGLSVSLAKIEEAKRQIIAAGLSYKRPIIYLITDGAPTDTSDWESAILEIQTAIRGKHAQLFCIGTDSANFDELKRTGGTVLRLNNLKWSELFQFLSNSMLSASKAEAGSKIQQPLTQSVTIES
jgi:uncharacterized protein YegL